MIIPETVSFHRDTPNRSDKLRAALSYARGGRPLFPLHSLDKHGVCTCGGPAANPECTPGKHPRTRRGHLEATTDQARITAWWNRWPDANIGMPTGERSGVLALDVDHPASLDELEAEHGKLPPTRTHSTGSGGMHYLFAYPSEAGVEVRNSVGKLGRGLDVRGEGGYIVVPPSTTTRPYEALDKLPLADPPPSLIEALREPRRTCGGGAGRTSEATAITADLDGPPIPDGTRDNTLTSIAGKRHDGTRTLDELAADLMAINEARCEPPLQERQVWKIARSIHARPPCKPSPVTTPETVEALEQIEAELWRREWPGMGGKSERDAYAALIVAARRHGTRVAAGVRVGIDVRSWSLAAAVSKRAMLDYWKHGERRPGIISRLKKRGLIRADNADRSGTKAGAFVLLMPRAEFHHSPTTEHLRGREEASGETLRAPRLRWSAPMFERIGDELYRSTIRRLGKGCGTVIDALERAGGSCTIEELADALHKNRTRDLRRRLIARLEAAAVVECRGDTVALVADWLEALNRERAVGGELAAYQRDMSRYARERVAYRNRRRIRPNRAPTAQQLAVGREERHKRLRIEQLVTQGMARRFAQQAVYGSDGPERYAERRRQYITAAIARLFSERPEYRTRRTGQITCAIARYIGEDFPRGPDGYPKDAEVEALLDGAAA